MAACLGTACPPHCSLLPAQHRGSHSLREAVGSCQHPVSRQQGPPTEVCSIVAKTDLPWPPAQAGVLASYNAVYRQLPAATVCGRQAVRGSWGSVRTHPTLGHGRGRDPALRESERTQPHPWGT